MPAFRPMRTRSITIWDYADRCARICAGYADHFLRDSFAAGHLVNKTLLIQWYIAQRGAAAGVFS